MISFNNYARWQVKNIESALRTRRVLLLAGPRQCGKTTLARNLGIENSFYRTLDDATILAAAVNDPNGFIRHADNLMIIDEIQRASLLLTAIKQDVDENQAMGRFLLTGSANIQSLPNATESLAGRVHKIRLRPLSMGEICGKSADFIDNAFAENFSDAQNTSADKNYYLELALRGGYPEILRFNNHREVRKWHRDYLDSLMERDLKDIANIKRKDSMLKLLEVLAAWSSKFMDVSAIGSSLSLSRPTLETYINALETLFLIERVRPWSKTDYDRVSRQDKLFMTDTGLIASILNWNLEKVQLNGELNGKLLESFVFTQLAAIIDARENNYQLYHYRDREKREIDFIVEDEDGNILGIEVKAGSAINKKHFQHLEWFKNNLIKNHKFTGIILYTGDKSLSFGNNLWAVPMNNLWA